MSFDNDWSCQVCGSVVEPMGQLGDRLHGRCRGCGLEHSQPSDPYEGLSQEVETALGQRPTLIPGPDYPHIFEEDEPFANDWKPRP